MIPVRLLASTTLCLALSALALTSASAQTINFKPDCMAIGGSWVPGGGPSRLGQCVLTRSYGIKIGETLEPGPSVDIVLDNSATLSNAGQLRVINSARVILRNGYLINEGHIAVNNAGVITLTRGQITNRGTLVSEGLIENNLPMPLNSSLPGGITNSGSFTVTSGGEIRNVGRFMSFGSGQLTVGRRGRFVNRAGSYYLAANDNVDGVFVNEAGGYIDNERVITVRAGGRLVNSGTMELGSIGNPLRGILTGERGSLIEVNHGGVIFSWHGKLYVHGELLANSGVIENFDHSTLKVIAPGVVTVSGRGRLTNHAGATIENLGSILIGCFASWQNNGTLTGNNVGRSLCYPWPINPPQSPFL